MAELLTFVLGDVFGVVTLLVGIFIGFWLGRLWDYVMRPKSKPAEEAQPNAESYRDKLAGMIQFTTHFSGDISKHIELLQNLEQKLSTPDAERTAEDQGGLSSKAVELIAQITAANQKLKQRLESAEATLKTQTRDLETSLSEARTDALTGLLNRRAFDEAGSQRWAHWTRKDHPFTLVLMDIDHFKKVNDQYGHDAGDQVLREVAGRLNTVVRQTDFLSRIGGEELALLIPESEWDAVVTVAQKILNVIRSEPVQYGCDEIQITLSCGLISSCHADSFNAMLRGADEALYAAKSSGRNCGFGKTNSTLIPIEGQQTASDSAGVSDSQQSLGNGQTKMTALPENGPLDSAASELKNRLLQISQG